MNITAIRMLTKQQPHAWTLVLQLEVTNRIAVMMVLQLTTEAQNA